MIRSGPNARIEYGLSIPLQWIAKQTEQRSVARLCGAVIQMF